VTIRAVLNATKTAIPCFRPSSTLLHLPIPIFCCLPALLCWALKIGSQNWPMWL